MELITIRAFDICHASSRLWTLLSFLVVLVLGYFVVNYIFTTMNRGTLTRHSYHTANNDDDLLIDIMLESEYRINISRLSFFMKSAQQKIHDIVAENNKSQLGPFATRFSENNLIGYFKLVEDFVNVMEAHDFTYIMYGGTLLGSYRHHGFIPWDDDLDFWVSATEMRRFKQTLRNNSFEVLPTHPNYTRVRKPEIFANFSDRIENNTSSWPYIHVMFFEDNGTHVWDISTKWDMILYKRSEIFPLHWRPYENILLPAPRDTLACLKKYYAPDVCSSNSFSHITGKTVRPYYLLPCIALFDLYPFVMRTGKGNNIVEKLVYQGQVLNTYQYSFEYDIAEHHYVK